MLQILNEVHALSAARTTIAEERQPIEAQCLCPCFCLRNNINININNTTGPMSVCLSVVTLTSRKRQRVRATPAAGVLISAAGGESDARSAAGAEELEPLCGRHLEELLEAPGEQLQLQPRTKPVLPGTRTETWETVTPSTDRD